ncbi:MAG TPA: multidrug transporter [Burkholderiales bacterium]|nr:multidrug transporter [Burkholderiales bacterium]
MKRLLLVIVALVVLGALALAFLASRKEAAQEAEAERPVKAPTRVTVVNGATVITLDETSRRASGIETAPVAPAQYRQELRAYGAVLELTRLTELFNSYAIAKAEVQTARAKLAASRTAYERARTLYKEDQNVSLARVQEAEAAFRSDEATVSASESRTETVAATARQEWGAVIAKALVERDPLITRLMERKEILLQVTVSPDVALTRPSTTAEVQTGKQSRATARLVSPAPRTDPKIQGASFFYVVPSGAGLVPGMSVVVYLARGETIAGAVIPGDAIVWWQDRAWIYRRSAPDAFTRVPIATSQPASGGYVVPDLPAGSEVVTRGAQLLLSEEFRAQIRVEE